MSATVFPSPEAIPVARGRRFSWSGPPQRSDPHVPDDADAALQRPLPRGWREDGHVPAEVPDPDAEHMPDDPWFRQLAELRPPDECPDPPHAVSTPRVERPPRSDDAVLAGATRGLDAAPRASTIPVATEVPRPSLPDRRRHLIEELRFRCSDPRLRAIALGLVAIAAGVFWYVSGTASGGATRSDDAVAEAQAAAASVDAGDAEPSVLTVHVAGAVVEAGVVELVAGSRIIDALEAVGGATAEADLDQLNLAAGLDDGQRVFVPKAGETIPPDAAGIPAEADGGGGGLLNLNTATKAQLQELPGIGPVLAESIINDRDKRGGYRAVEDLRGVSGIGDKRFEDIKELVTVG